MIWRYGVETWGGKDDLGIWGDVVWYDMVYGMGS